MKRILPVVLVALTAIGFTQTAQAELLIEPVLGWSANQHYNLSRGENYTSGNGVSYGGRLGFQKAGFQVGADFLQSSIDMSSHDFNNNVDSTEWAGFVGFEFPVLFRVYAGYIFSAEADSDLNRTTVKFEDGTGGKIGLGFTLLPFVDLNLEYRRGTYDKTKIGGFDSNQDTDFEALMFSVSLPVTI